MKTLYLLRHAKSSWDDATLPDRERPLEPRGERDAAKMSKHWSQRHDKPDMIVSSPAARALATAKIVAQGLEYKTKKITVADRLYAATEDSLLAVIEGLDDTLGSVMLVGHNPGITELAQHFDSKIAHMPTCALAEFSFEAESWAGIGQARPVHTFFGSPKRPSP
jgi:phosphohistidine phosphatase